MLQVRRQRWPHEVKRRPIGHREGGIGAIDFYTEWKSVYLDYSDTLQRRRLIEWINC